MFKRFRFYIWLVSGILSRYFKIIFISFILGIVLVVFFANYSSSIIKILKKDHQVIGLVGSYTPTTLPSSIQRLISSGLTDIDGSGDVVPAIANSWEVSDEGKLYKFYLKSNLYWHDGQKFTANDVNYNLRDVIFTAESDSVLQVKLINAFTPLPSFLTKPLFKKGLVGLGSYRISGIRLKGENVVQLKLAPLSKDLPVLEFKVYPSETAAKTAFKLGEVDLLNELENPTPLNEWKNVTVTEVVKYDRYVGLFYNLKHPLLKEKNFRQALTFAIYKPEKNRTATPLSTRSWAYTNRVKQYDQDLEQAKKLLTNFKSSASATLKLSTFASELKQAQVISATWESLGINTEIKVENGIPQTYDVLLATQEIPTDPDQYIMWHSTQTQTNISGFNSPKVDKALEDGRKELDKEKRQKIYYDFQRFLVEDAPAAFLYHPTSYTIYR